MKPIKPAISLEVLVRARDLLRQHGQSIDSNDPLFGPTYETIAELGFVIAPATRGVMVPVAGPAKERQHEA